MLRKHITSTHAGQDVKVIELSESEAAATLTSYIAATSEPQPTSSLAAVYSDSAAPTSPDEVGTGDEPKASPADVTPTNHHNDDDDDDSGDDNPHDDVTDAQDQPKVSQYDDDDVEDETYEMDSDSEQGDTVDDPLDDSGDQSASHTPNLLPDGAAPGNFTSRCRPFQCSLCGRRSNWKWDVTKHIKVVYIACRLYLTLFIKLM